ncbi:ParM/StbA family protein [Anoxybacillus rupiensis]|uniref:ParM/StbA family protein n=1 Tax=Anoxybacteroides rupiense TaxID=311460 RepID=A0ABD5IR53_9BACL|nr:ParM/StbA family protein [Anoxybacillus rupiensis]
MILGIDAGNKRTKVVTAKGAFAFESSIGEYRERKLVQRFGDDDMIFEYQGKRWFAGTLAQYESEFGGSRKGDTKAHEEAKYRILLAIHRYSNEIVNDIVVGQPISRHTDDEKQKIFEMLRGEHIVSVDYGDGMVEKRIIIRHVLVAAEGSAAILSQPQNGLIRIIDIGSGTINFGSVSDMRFIDRDSFTERFGLETSKTKDMSVIARKIANVALEKWDENDHVRLAGGGAIPLRKLLKTYFSNCEILKPVHNNQELPPAFANAVAFYKIGAMLYEGY